MHPCIMYHDVVVVIAVSMYHDVVVVTAISMYHDVVVVAISMYHTSLD